MPFIEWSESLSVGVKSIDEEHEQLILLLNDFYQNIYQASPYEKLIKLIVGLKDYTITHFAHEEKIMERYGYPNLPMHKKEHEKFIRTVEEFEARYTSGRLLLTLEVTGFIKHWIIAHIMGTDKLYSDFLIEKGAK
ncbi:hemerythrin-like metal-binding protein [Chloroherpeton thalassium ATCC 35110]|uniref:Hemerythrin-like metal-binding protein n=1 Tax=Chloroherpeton thalassium (strain ATCC 35110 / GB-78) TaxID=517418 RepID=B3QVC0_CHLT3|nr:bacteriohemerythrin [Chloroherpeton thalassium]ACF13074.1 hemerythrin-like metal-binding protein [Chloroherpeton thalassium ATCC 35110]